MKSAVALHRKREALPKDPTISGGINFPTLVAAEESFETHHNPRFGAWKEKTLISRLLNDPWYRLLATIQSNVFDTSISWFVRHGLGTLNFPITTKIVSCPSGVGSDSSPIEIGIWGQKAYLTDSNQFFLETACRLFKKGAYSVVPCFRGDVPDNSHLSQFYQAEAEIPGDLEDAMVFAEAYVRELAKFAFAGCEHLLEGLGIDTLHVKKFAANVEAIPRITLEEACGLLRREHVRVDSDGGFRTITREGERLLMDEFGGALWLTHMDYLAVPFYQASLDSTMRSAKTADLLMGVGEVVGLGERHVTADDMYSSLQIRRIDPSEYEWYLQLRRESPMRTAGFGLGLERFYCWLLSHTDIRDCQFFPRIRGIQSEP